MALGMIVADTRPGVLAAWSEVFHGLKEVTFANVAPPKLFASHEIDIALLPTRIVHERYGARLRAGLVDIVSTGAAVGLPRWALSLPPLPPGTRYSLEERVYTGLTAVFRAIKDFNLDSHGREIRVIGLALEGILGDADDARAAAVPVRRAYVEECEASSGSADE